MNIWKQPINIEFLAHIHLGPAGETLVHALHTGRSTQVLHIDLFNDAGEITCVSRITMAVLAPR